MALEFTADGLHLLGAVQPLSGPGLTPRSLFFWDAPGAWPARACELAGRTFTADERAPFGIEKKAACDG